MAPFLSTLMTRESLLSSRSISDEFKSQWLHPGDVFSVLLILGGEIIARALAQLAGSGLTPVTFSFGWVAYSVTALVSAVGENKLMPPDPDCKCKVINGRNGFTRDNSSWILGRMMRDFDQWSHPATKEKVQSLLDEKWTELKRSRPLAKRPTRAGLIATIYEPSKTQRLGVAQRDFVYWSGIFTMAVQLGIAAIPCGLFDDWGILLITVCGNILALATGYLPQWKKEKWACRTQAKGTYILTRGNGSQHVIIIVGNGHGLNLEDLAAGQTNIEASTNALTRLTLLVLALLWVLLLITASGVKDHTWYLLAVGGIGIIQNVFVAGGSRRPENFGIPLDFVEVLGRTKVMDTLLEMEKKYSGMGRALLEEFFPRKLHPEDLSKWEAIDQSAAQAREDGMTNTS
ncbi:hypothetical protein PDE_08078 [Penicillium oxalicum 114-2]|uniref:Uncharacterized protein n=1 Tax=Penicillium oxalicum (strain 114-2 / CGMCC 5302) TaxID=933388 RepID=S7ZWG4_PENO1|nr:hypothetical protein PDE_08078 [Penicillium oxalicum 114-2]